MASEFYRHLKAKKPHCMVYYHTTKGRLNVAMKSAVALVRHKGPEPFIKKAEKLLGGRAVGVTVECTQTRGEGLVFSWDQWSGSFFTEHKRVGVNLGGGAQLGRARRRRRR